MRSYFRNIEKWCQYTQGLVGVAVMGTSVRNI